MANHPNRSRTPAFFNRVNTPGYTDAGLAALNRARNIIIEDHGLEMPGLPDAVREEIDAKIRDRLTNTHGRNLGVRMLLALWADS